jgi:hypothetical protein
VELREPAADDFDAWVGRLHDPLRGAAAARHLVDCGAAAREAVARGLGSPHAETRRRCARVLDRVADASTVNALVALLDDVDAAVRVEALHALSCDRCTSDRCGPPADDVLAKAIELLAADPDAHARAYAVELVGRFVHTHDVAARALVAAASDDPAPAVRKKAAWYAPGGPIHARTRSGGRRAASRVDGGEAGAVDRPDIVLGEGAVVVGR